MPPKKDEQSNSDKNIGLSLNLHIDDKNSQLLKGSGKYTMIIANLFS